MITTKLWKVPVALFKSFNLSSNSFLKRSLIFLFIFIQSCRGMRSKIEIPVSEQSSAIDSTSIDNDEIAADLAAKEQEIEDINKKWTIIQKNEYHYEEKFTVFNKSSLPLKILDGLSK